jgi:hypothetical protein
VVACAAEPRLQRGEVNAAVFFMSDDDLAVKQRSDRKCLSSPHQLWEPGPKVAAVPAQ